VEPVEAMRLAVVLSLEAMGRTSPNPPVGAVVLDADGEVAGTGVTAPAGGPHAEVVALGDAGARARGGTAVVTLEPCAHTGRTGPCTDALLAAGVARVVVACADPTALAGGGAEVLRRHGVEVEVGLLAGEVAQGPLEPWLTAQRTGRPFVLWKAASTLDGRTAAADGTSRWITGEAARAEVHRLRDAADAVLVGVGTVVADDPQLTVRPDPGRQPLRVVLDRSGRTPATARVRDGEAETLVLDLAPRAALAALADRGVVSVLLEGGATVAGAFLREGLVDKVVTYVAPLLLGEGAPLVAQLGVSTIADARRLRLDDVGRVGDDVRLVLRPPSPQEA
jgi:diaminohydroxyphosphoribosylaminopyrimidine deaminase / 5-amino-6-(5-phosphoribosylamino)uracil reductase